MKLYLATTGVVFGLIVIAHVLRVIDEGTELATSPGFLALTAGAAVLCVWAGWLLRSARR